MPPKPLYRISLAQWSINRQLFAGEIDSLDFAPLARERFDIGAVEYVSRFLQTASMIWATWPR